MVLHSTLVESYEKKEGKIRCPQRVENNEKRRRGMFVKYRENKNYKAAQQSRKQQQKQAREQREIAQNTDGAGAMNAAGSRIMAGNGID
ncbi:MAG: hypothetical protein H6936_18150 [Burkholderiales bacterium]|nr:hypothetical protein [Burkholderiales bacterium]